MNHDQPTDDRHARERTGTSPPLFTYVTGPICVRIQDISPSVAWYLWSYVRVAYSTLGPLKALYLACIHTQFRLGTSLVAFTNFRAFCVFVFYRCAFSTVVHLKGVGQLQKSGLKKGIPRIGMPPLGPRLSYARMKCPHP